ncbi:MAG: tetratricopeptide repeat protein [bacterium]|nr:tetratricopeptide repeat protein [bacterium]
MSLLQEALRKAQRLGGSSTTPSLPPLRGGSTGKRGTRWKLIAGILAAAFAVGVAGVLFLTLRSAPPPAIPPVPAPSQAIPLPSPAVTPPLSPAAPAPSGAPPAAPPTAAVSGPASTRPTAKAGSSRVRVPSRPAPHRASASPVPATEDPAITGTAPLPVPAERIDPVLEKFNAGVAAMNRGDAEGAARLLREVTASSPGLVEGWNALGLALLRQKRLDEADAVFSTVLSLSPRYVPGLLNAGLLRLEQGRMEEGAALFSRASDLSPGALAPRVNLAVAQARSGKFGQAEETLLAANRRFPGHPDVLYHLGTVYDRVGNRAKGVEAYAAFLAASAGSRPSTEDRVRARLREWGVSP